MTSQATDAVYRTASDAQDYVFSTWDDSQLKKYLVDNGYVKSDYEAKRDELLSGVRDAYTATTQAPYEIYSDSYLHDWLVSHGIVKSPAQKTREEYVGVAALVAQRSF